MQGKNSSLPTNRQEARKIYFHGARLETTLQGGCESLCASGFRALAEKIGVAAKLLDRRERDRIGSVLNCRQASGRKFPRTIQDTTMHALFVPLVESEDG
jgi:hypothetical protein